MKKTIFITLVLAALIAAAFTCPDKEAHQKAFEQNLNKAVNQQMGNSKLGNVTGTLLAGLFLHLTQDDILEYHNYFLFSTAKVQDETVSVGLFNQVFSCDLDDLGDKD